MLSVERNAELNQLLINLNRSLLQYVGEAWPWTADADSSEQRTIARLVERQKAWIARLADLLAERGWTIDFGVYPTEYTDLHYVALDYLLKSLLSNQTALLADVAQTLMFCRDDVEASTLLNGIRSDQDAALRQLEELAAGRRNGAAA
jgi:hypothetical protein